MVASLRNSSTLRPRKPLVRAVVARISVDVWTIICYRIVEPPGSAQPPFMKAGPLLVFENYETSSFGFRQVERSTSVVRRSFRSFLASERARASDPCCLQLFGS